mmetsp:Transcript_12056/g.22881  ORF Transcript_12056/g.22881 Transcript_12056/m.22881 type:complete len:220 (-) Transcript_12056:163-822(-)
MVASRMGQESRAEAPTSDIVSNSEGATSCAKDSESPPNSISERPRRISLRSRQQLESLAALEKEMKNSRIQWQSQHCGQAKTPRRVCNIKELKAMAAKLEKELLPEPHQAERDVCNIRFDVQQTGQTLRRRFRMSDPISAVYSFVKWGIASGATALSRDENCRTDLLAEDNIHAELISRGFSLVQALGLPQPLPCNSRAPLGDLGISQNEKLIATMSCV